MLCIITFAIFLILFPILGFFPSYRQLFKKSWSCVFKKVTLKPCDIDLGSELKNSVLKKIVFRFPKLANFLDKTFSFWAVLFIIVNIWSLVAVSLTGLNLWVYDTCDPITAEGCSLSGESCGIAAGQLDFQAAVSEGKMVEFAIQPFQKLAETVSRVPDRLKVWNATDYLSSNPSYFRPYDQNKSIAVEFIDPGCQYCRKLFWNIKDSNFLDRYNLTYVVYPIADSSTPSGYKFQASYQIATYLEAVKTIPLDGAEIPADWQLLEKIFSKPAGGVDTQNSFNNLYTKAEIPDRIEDLLREVGYTDSQILQIRAEANSPTTKQKITEQVEIVEQKLRTIKIPTIVFGGRRYDRVIDTATLNTN